MRTPDTMFSNDARTEQTEPALVGTRNDRGMVPLRRSTTTAVLWSRSDGTEHMLPFQDTPLPTVPAFFFFFPMYAPCHCETKDVGMRAPQEEAHAHVGVDYT